MLISNILHLFYVIEPVDKSSVLGFSPNHLVSKIEKATLFHNNLAFNS